MRFSKSTLFLAGLLSVGSIEAWASEDCERHVIKPSDVLVALHTQLLDASFRLARAHIDEDVLNFHYQATVS